MYKVWVAWVTFEYDVGYDDVFVGVFSTEGKAQEMADIAKEQTKKSIEKDDERNNRPARQYVIPIPTIEEVEIDKVQISLCDDN